MTLSQCFTISVDYNGTARIVAMLVFSYPITGHQIALILQCTGSSQQLPSRLAAFRPVGHQHDNIVVQGTRITAPTREAQVVAGQQQYAESGVFDDGMILTRRVELVFVSESEKMMFIVK